MLKKRRISWGRIVLVFALVVIAVFAFMKLTTKAPQEQPKTQELAAAIVNGQVITFKEINDSYYNLPPVYRAETSPQQILNETIEYTLLLQEAAIQNIIISAENVDDAVNSYLITTGYTSEEFNQTLARRGMAMDDFRQDVYEQLRIKKLLNIMIYREIYVTDDEISAMYNSSGLAEQNLSLYDAGAGIKYSISAGKAEAAYDLYIRQLKAKSDIQVLMK